MIFAGVDIGSLTADTVLLDEHGVMLAFDITPTGANGRLAGEKSLKKALASLDRDVEELTACVATGYGRVNAPFTQKTVTEITCHARGAFHLFPETRTVIDIGGQDSKVIRVGNKGQVLDFAMNDKCAAGTGRFLEVMAKALEIELDRLGPLSLEARETIPISSMCTVFAESAGVSLVAQGRPLADIGNGLHVAIVQRVAAMVQRLGVRLQVTMTGGVAKNNGLVAAMKNNLGVNINVPLEPQIIGALGAALMAREMKPDNR
ncbi:MAG: 2-hydroxyglutaryl-CoA dehydratase [Deltaproteobacteria bacterium]|nr:2-hydroxyglutaryl-CoA dehydratase [Deltaproteobacteria bacterium]